MKIIDILNKKAEGTLEDGFKFCYRDKVFTYDQKLNRIYIGNNTIYCQLGEIHKLEECLNDEVLLFQEEVKETEKREENKEIEEVENISYNFTKTSYTGIELSKNFETITKLLNKQSNKINELVRAVNKLNKEREEK